MLINSVGSYALQNYDSYGKLLKIKDDIISVITSVICVTTNYDLKLGGVFFFFLRHFATRKI